MRIWNCFLIFHIDIHTISIRVFYFPFQLKIFIWYFENDSKNPLNFLPHWIINFFRIISNFHDWNARETDFQHLITRRYSGYWFLPLRLTQSSHSKYSAAKSEIKGAIILIRRKLFPSGGMTAYRGINGQLFAADLLSLSCATTRVSVSYLPRFFHSTWWRTTRTVPCEPITEPGPGEWPANTFCSCLHRRLPAERFITISVCIGYNTTIRFVLIVRESFSYFRGRGNYIIFSCHSLPGNEFIDTYIFGIWILSASFCLPKSCQGRDLGGFGLGLELVAAEDTKAPRCTCACAWLCCSCSCNGWWCITAPLSRTTAAPAAVPPGHNSV